MDSPNPDLKELVDHSYKVVRRIRDYRHAIHGLNLLVSVKSPTFWALWRDMQRLLTNLEPLLSRHSGRYDGEEPGLADALARTQERLFWATAMQDLATDEVIDGLEGEHLGEDLDS